MPTTSKGENGSSSSNSSGSGGGGVGSGGGGGGDLTPSFYSPLTRKPSSGQHSASYGFPGPLQFATCHANSGSKSFSSSCNSKTQYDALPVGTLGTYDPAADEIDYSFYQNARPNRRRLLYCRSSASAQDPDLQDDDKNGDGLATLNGGGGGGGGGGRKKNRGRRDCAGRSRSSTDLADPGLDESLLDEAELSTETLYVMLLVLASTAVTMLAAYLILL